MARKTGNGYLGTSDFSLENVTIYQNSTKIQTLNIYLFRQEMAFTILLDVQIDGGFASNGNLNMDYVSGGAITGGNFTNGLGMRHYQGNIINYLYNSGPYVSGNTNDTTAHKLCVRYDPTLTKNVKGWIDSKTSQSTKTFVQSDNPLHLGGSNNHASSGAGYGTINQLMIYYRALSDADIENYINNGIIP